MGHATRIFSYSTLILAVLFLLFMTMVGCSKILPEKKIEEQPFELKFRVLDQFTRFVGEQQYVVVTYDVSTIPLSLFAEKPDTGSVVYVKFFEQGGFATPLSASTQKPARGVFALATVAGFNGQSAIMSYEFDTITMPSHLPINSQSITSIKVALDNRGRGSVLSFYYEE
ncbi:MAG TPA: hypothetical protein VK158_04365 [Acidobacteriota bacterium]|nr:hypothetical protein [Acidobacteriota bacterium]